jgi:uncharacterized membrane protein (UPF0127 family)
MLPLLDATKRRELALRASRRPLQSLVLLAAALACGEAQAPPSPGPETIWLPIGGETFTLEVALDPESRQRGLSGRPSIPRNGGMLFVHERPRAVTMVMRDCPVPIDVAFLDAGGGVVAIHAMQPEPPRRPDEGPFEYARRLRGYPSGRPVQFALEVAGGRLAELGIAVGQRIRFDGEALVRQAR